MNDLFQSSERINDEFLLSWQLCTSPFPHSESFDAPRLSCRWAGISFRFYNALCLRGSFDQPSELTSVLQDGLDFMRQRQAPGWLVVTHEQLAGDTPGALRRTIDKERLTTMPATGMEGDILPLQPAAKRELRFERILDRVVAADFIDLNSKAYNLPLEAGRSVLADLTFWRDHAYGFVAYEGNRPVATATGIVTADCIFLFLVATDPERQRQGYADAVIRHALNAAHRATGIRRTSLQATDAGRPLYAKLGYREVCHYTLLWPSE